MSEVRVNNLSNENNTGGPTISGITTYSGRHFFVPPVGDTASRPSSCEPGSLRFNTDSAHLEYFRGDTIGWIEIEAELASDVLGLNTGLGARALFTGGQAPGDTDAIDFINVSTLGNSVDFGNLTTNLSNTGSGASRTRGLICGGEPIRADIEFVTFASTGNATDFGDLTTSSAKGSAVANQTRAVRQAGQSPSANPEDTMDFVTIASTGNATDYGDAMVATKTHSGATDFHGGLQG